MVRAPLSDLLETYLPLWGACETADRPLPRRVGMEASAPRFCVDARIAQKLVLIFLHIPRLRGEEIQVAAINPYSIRLASHTAHELGM
jgi:hypothetical protein